MLKNMYSMVLKHKFQLKSLNLWQSFYLCAIIVVISGLDCEIWPSFIY